MLYVSGMICVVLNLLLTYSLRFSICFSRELQEMYRLLVRGASSCSLFSRLPSLVLKGSARMCVIVGAM